MSSLIININREDRGVNYSIDLSKCESSYQIREAIKTSLELFGYTNIYALELFNEYQDVEGFDNIKKE